MALKRMFAIAKTVLTLSIFLGIAGFAVFSIAAQGTSNNQPVRLEASDDALHNGLNIINQRRQEPPRAVMTSDTPLILLLDDWIYTATKPKTSAFT